MLLNQPSVTMEVVTCIERIAAPWQSWSRRPCFHRAQHADTKVLSRFYDGMWNAKLTYWHRNERSGRFMILQTSAILEVQTRRRHVCEAPLEPKPGVLSYSRHL